MKTKYNGFTLTAVRGHIEVHDSDGNFFESADDLYEACADIDAEITLDDLHDSFSRVTPIPTRYSR